jgi:hypothetical protein
MMRENVGRGTISQDSFRNLRSLLYFHKDQPRNYAQKRETEEESRGARTGADLSLGAGRGLCV